MMKNLAFFLYSISSAIAITEEVTGKSIPVEIGDRRPGDPPILVGSSEKARKILGWQPKYPNLEDMIAHAWYWHQKRHSICSEKVKLQDFKGASPLELTK